MISELHGASWVLLGVFHSHTPPVPPHLSIISRSNTGNKKKTKSLKNRNMLTLHFYIPRGFEEGVSVD